MMEESPDAGSFLTYDQFCDLLGAATWKQAYNYWTIAGLIAEEQLTAGGLPQRYSGSRQFLFEDDTQVLPLEVFWLKWNLFTALCRRVLQLHQTNLRPHLGIEPAKVQIRVSFPVDSWMPTRWLFALKLVVPELSLLESVKLSGEGSLSLFVPPQNHSSLFVAPVIREWPRGRQETVTALIRSSEQVRNRTEPGIQGLVHVHVISDTIVSSEFSEQDVFALHVQTSARGSSPICMWGRKVEAAERGFVLSGMTEAMPMSDWDNLQKNTAQVFSNSKLVIYKAFHVPCDLYSLGMMLGQTLLVNEDQNMGQVGRALQKVIGGLEPLVVGIGPNDTQTLSKRLTARLKEFGAVFSKSAMMHQRQAGLDVEAVLPDDLWYDALILGLRLVSWIPNFSICTGAGDYDNKAPYKVMEQVVQAAERLTHRIRIELFGCRQRNREILEACDLVRAELANRNG